MADKVSLQDVEAEFALVGSMLAWPGVMQIVADQIDPDWFTDEPARLFFVAARKVHADGGQISRQAVLGNLPANANDTDPLLLNKLYAGLFSKAVPAAAVPGVLSLVRDRWARRVLIDVNKFVDGAVRVYDTDPFDLSHEIIAQVDRIHASRRARDAGTLLSGTDALLDDIEAGRAVRSFTTGLRAVDEKLGRYKAGQLYVVAARPAMGKSTFALSSLLRAAQAGHGVAMFSLEMTEEEVIARCLSDLSDHEHAPSYSTILRRQLNDLQKYELRQLRDTLERIPLHFDYSPQLTLRDIAGRARALKAELEHDGRRLDILCVDHLTIIAPSDRYRGNPVMEVSQNIDGLRVLAKELDCAVLVLCQLSRDVEKREDKRPILADLRWTGEIEQAAHVVAFLFREEYYLKSDPDADPHRLRQARSEMDFLVRKNRQGETGDVQLRCSMAHSSVRDR